jgi:two-component system, response regulator YesN
MVGDRAVRRRPGILIAEDDPRVRSFLRTALLGAGRIFEVGDGEQALGLLRAHAGRHIDLVLVDYRLPKHTGIEVLRDTKQRWPWIRVVLITGFGSEGLAVEAFRDGVNDYLAKPIRLESLLRIVQALLPRGEVVASRSPWRVDESERVDDRIQHVVTFLEQHFADGVTMADLAATIGLSRFHFSRLFHRATGRTFQTYVAQLRVDRAKMLLANHAIAVTHVARSVGFKGVSHLDRTFRKIVGQSPTEYRRALQKARGPLG